MICWSKNEVLLCQCKKERVSRNYIVEKRRLCSVPLPPGGKRLLWVKRGASVFVHPVSDVVTSGHLGRIHELSVRMMLNVAKGVKG